MVTVPPAPLVFSLSGWYKINMKAINLKVLVALTLLAASCAGGPVNVPYDLGPMEIIQLAQEASDRNRYSTSLQYYEIILERFPHDIDSVCAAEYEIAFIHYKQRRFDAARDGFHNLLLRYDHPDGELLPQQFRILSNIVLQRMDEMETFRRGRG